MSAAEMLAGAAPERTPDRHSIEWKNVWRTVRRLQASIVKAVAEGRWNKVKALVYQFKSAASQQGAARGCAGTPGVVCPHSSHDLRVGSEDPLLGADGRPGRQSGHAWAWRKLKNAVTVSGD